MKLRACKGSLVFSGDRDMCTQQFLLDTCEMYIAHWSRGWLWVQGWGQGNMAAWDLHPHRAEGKKDPLACPWGRNRVTLES